ncbi:MAG: carboxypeptidase regulatory-like domain-containing protein, partial [Terriglobia bacterium]
PYDISWNFQIQRQLPADSLFSIGYVGSRGLNLYNNLLLNQLSDSALAQGNALLKLVANPFYGKISSGILSNAKIAEGQLLRPFPQFDTMTADDATWASSTYHALQVEYEKRFSHGFNLTASYTWSKLMDNTTGAFNGQPLSGTAYQDYHNLRAEWAVSALDLPQRFVVGYMWELPFGPGKRFAAGGVLGRVVGGWQMGGITTLQTGEILGVTDTTNTTFSNGGGQRPNWNGVNPAIGNPAIGRWFNTDVFSQPASFTFGSAPRTFASLHADPVRNFDFSLIKNTKISERLSLQFRAEFFNLFNTVQFAPPDTTFNTPNFGAVTSQLNQPRIIQFALKLLF